MEGTREFLLDKIIAWATGGSAQKNGSNTYWIYGSPGIGKTSLAHSISGRLHDQKQLAGAYFCQRDDPNLKETRNILPTLINKLAIIFPPFRSIVAKHLRNDPNLTPESIKESLLHDLICSLLRHPKHTLVFVLDALDECGDARSQSGVLRALTNAAAQAPWMRVIITSRPEVGIQRFFDHSSHLRFDLAADRGASADLRTFAQQQFDMVASDWHLPTPWPEKSLFNGVISRANGLFIFIKTLVLALEDCRDPTLALVAALQGSAGAGVTSLYGLYSGILRARISHSHAEFRKTIGVLLAAASYRPLCEETVAELAGVSPNLVKKWVDGLSSLLYRDEGLNGGIRARHLSISDFFMGDKCPGDYHVDLRDANMQLGITCLRTMLGQLRFNICKLEDSRLANADIQDLQSRIERNISDALQYSCLYWSNHLCSSAKNDDRGVWEQLRNFFEGCYPLFWIEVLSLMGMVSTSVPSLRRVILTWVKASRASAWSLLGYSNIILGH